MISGEGISSESEGAADLLDSILGHGNALEEDSVAGTPKPKKAVQRQSAQKKPSAAAAATDEAAAPEGPPRGPQPLKLELKGLPLQVAPGSNAEERVLLQPHQKLMRLSIDGDPSADPVELLKAYFASLAADGQTPGGDLCEDRHVQAGGNWYSVQRSACRGELLLGPHPADTQLLTPQRHLGHLTFSRCEQPEDSQAQGPAEEDNSWEMGPSFAQFHKVQHYGTNVKPRKPKKAQGLR